MAEPHATDIGPLEAAIALTGIVAVVILAVFSMWFYGSGGQASTVAVLGASLGVIGSVVGAVVGVAMGTKTGSAAGAAGLRAGEANTKLARSVTKSTQSALTTVRNAHLAAAATKSPSPTADEVTAQIDAALAVVNRALDDIQ